MLNANAPVSKQDPNKRNAMSQNCNEETRVQIKWIMSEEDVKLKLITPAIEKVGWDKQKQIRMEYNFTDGRVIVRGNVTARGKRKRADYLLYYKPNIPL